jgi:hypothetical protein
LRRVRVRSPLGIVCLSAVLTAAVAAIGATVWVVSAWSELPGVDAVRHIGDMDRATTVYDHHGRFAF